MLPELRPVARWVQAANPADPVAGRPALQVVRQADRAVSPEVAVSLADPAARQGAASPEVWAEAASPAEVRPAVDADVTQRLVEFSMFW
jgi:hypothetical protein